MKIYTKTLRDIVKLSKPSLYSDTIAQCANYIDELEKRLISIKETYGDDFTEDELTELCLRERYIYEIVKFRQEK